MSNKKGALKKTETYDTECWPFGIRGTVVYSLQNNALDSVDLAVMNRQLEKDCMQLDKPVVLPADFMGYRTTYQNLVQGKAAEYQQLMDSINAVYKVADKRNLHYSILLIRGHLFSIYGYYYRLNYMNHFTTAQGKGSLAKDLDVLVNWVINGLEINMMAIKDKDEFENERTSHRYLGLCRMFATVFEMHIQPCLVQLHGPIDSGGQYAKLITALDDCLEHLEWVATAMYYAEHMRKMREIVAIIERSSSLFRVLEYSAAR